MDDKIEREENLDRVLSKVRGLVAKAESLSASAEKADTSEADATAWRNEADACRQMADALMLKHAIEEIGQQQARPLTDQVKPIIITIELGQDSDITGYINWLVIQLAQHCRCRVRQYTKWTHDNGWQSKIYGYESDVRYFELLYTTIRLHMLGVLLPRVQTQESLEDNAYRLHNSGYNWLQIAEMYGWKKYHWTFAQKAYEGTIPPNDMKTPYWHKDHGWQPATQVGSRIKRAYHRACAERGEPVQKIAANGTATYRKSAADGYVITIGRRLGEIQKGRTAGSELILRSAADMIDKLFRDDNPDLFKAPEPVDPKAKKPRVRRNRVRPAPYHPDAYSRGAAHARTADLNASPRAGSGQRGEIGA